MTLSMSLYRRYTTTTAATPIKPSYGVTGFGNGPPGCADTAMLLALCVVNLLPLSTDHLVIAGRVDALKPERRKYR